jgi:hypothetical protein
MLVILMTGVLPLQAQRQAAGFTRWPTVWLHESLPSPKVASVPAMAVVGAVAGAAGLFGGAALGSALGGGNRICGDDPCGLVGGAYGAMAGEALLLPLGVHLVNHRRGSYGTSLLASLGAGAAAAALLNDVQAGVVVVPLVQLTTAILVERATSRRSRRARAPDTASGPGLAGP